MTQIARPELSDEELKAKWSRPRAEIEADLARNPPAPNSALQAAQELPSVRICPDCQAHGVRKVEMWDFSRLNMLYTLMSKRKLQWFVDNKHVEGWYDPRFPTVQGIMRKGMTVQALKEFMLEQGPSQNNNLMEWDKIWAINKQKAK